MPFSKTTWQKVQGVVQEGAGWYTAVGICAGGNGKPFVRVTRGRAIPGGDPETGAPVKQAQKWNVKSRERWEQVKAVVDQAFEDMESGS